MRLIKQSFEIEQAGNLLTHIENAGRTCYQSKAGEDTTDRFIRGIIKSGHESVLEHGVVGVRFVISRATSHQLVRHRLCAYSQESMRYCNYSNSSKFDGHVTYIIPSIIRDLIPNNTILSSIDEVEKFAIDTFMNEDTPYDLNAYRWLLYMISAETRYKELVEGGWKAEDAREVLPQSTKTELVLTANVREWRHIFKMRCDKHAQLPIRMLMRKLHEKLREKYACLFDDLKFED
jgi:thymidylate synthase (FAD)